VIVHQLSTLGQTHVKIKMASSSSSRSSSRGHSPNANVDNISPTVEGWSLAQDMTATPESSQKTSTPPQSEHNVPKRPGVDPLLREYPKPAEDINVESAIGRRPARWSFKGQIEAYQHRATKSVDNVEQAEKRRQEFEAAKKELLGSIGETKA
jgi:hypothetical protein